MTEYVYPIGRLKGILADSKNRITGPRRQQINELIEAAEHRGQSTVILMRPATAPDDEQLQIEEL